MRTVTYREFRTALGILGFVLVRSGKHESWRKVLEDGTVLRTVVQHQHGADIPRDLFRQMCRQVGVTPDELFAILGKR